MRVLTNLTKALLAGAEIPARLVARVTTGSGTYRVTDADEDISWGGHTFKGFGQSLKMTAGAATTRGRAQGGEITLSATEPDVLATFFAEDYRGRPVDVGLVIGNPADGAWSEEIPVLKGRADTAKIEHGATDPRYPERSGEATLTLNVAPQTADLDRPGTRTRSDADQRLHRDAADGFFKDTVQVATAEIYWGRYPPSGPMTGGGGRGGAGFFTVVSRL